MSWQRIRSVFVPLPTVIQGGTEASGLGSNVELWVLFPSIHCDPRARGVDGLRPTSKPFWLLYYQLLWDRGISRHRILSAFVPLSTVIQGGAVGGWGPVAEAKTAESLGTTFNLCELFTQDIQTDFQLILNVSYLDLRFRQVFWFLVTWATGPTGTSTPCKKTIFKRSISTGPLGTSTACTESLNWGGSAPQYDGVGWAGDQKQSPPSCWKNTNAPWHIGQKLQILLQLKNLRI